MRSLAATIACTIFVFAMGIPPLLSFGPWSYILIFEKNFIELYDYTSSSILFPLVGILGAVLVGYIWDRKVVESELTSDGLHPF